MELSKSPANHNGHAQSHIWVNVSECLQHFTLVLCFYSLDWSVPTLAHMPQPMHSSSEMNAILSTGVTSMHNLPEQDKHILFNHIHVKNFIISAVLYSTNLLMS